MMIGRVFEVSRVHLLCKPVSLGWVAGGGMRTDDGGSPTSTPTLARPPSVCTNRVRGSMGKEECASRRDDGYRTRVDVVNGLPATKPNYLHEGEVPRGASPTMMAGTSKESSPGDASVDTIVCTPEMCGSSCPSSITEWQSSDSGSCLQQESDESVVLRRVVRVKGDDHGLLALVFGVEDTAGTSASSLQLLSPFMKIIRDVVFEHHCGSQTNSADGRVATLHFFVMSQHQLMSKQINAAEHVAKSGFALSVMLCHTPAILLYFCVLSSIALERGDIDLSETYCYRASLMLQPSFKRSILSLLKTPDLTEEEGECSGMGDPSALHGATSVCFCQAFVWQCTGAMLSAKGRYREAVDNHYECEMALRSLTPCELVCRMLVTTLHNIANNLLKQNLPVQAQIIRAAAHSVTADSCCISDSEIVSRVNDALILAKTWDYQSAVKALQNVFSSIEWLPDIQHKQIDVLVALINLLPCHAQSIWVEQLDAALLKTGRVPSLVCFLCSEPSSVSIGAGGLYVTPCLHLFHLHCWEAHVMAHERGSHLVCPGR